MRFLVTFTDAAGAWEALSAPERARAEAERGALTGALRAKGWAMGFTGEGASLSQGAGGLVETRDGTGPLSGFFVVEAGSLEEALEWARRSRVVAGTTEVRPVADEPT